MTTAPPAATDVLEKVKTLGSPGTPVTTPEVAEGFDCTQRTIYNRLDSLVNDGVLQTKKIGANSRVWWRPARVSMHNGGELDANTTDIANASSEQSTGSVSDTAPRQVGLPVPDARVLVADDNTDMREYLQRLLGQQWDVKTVPDGETALEAAREWDPDLVLANVMMPNLDGFELLHALRDDPETREKPVIMLSARAGEQSRVEGIEAGADDYMVKPFSARELVARVGATLELAQVRKVAKQKVRESKAELADELATTRELQEISTELIGEADIEALAARMLDAAIDIVDADFASFQLYNPDRNDLKLVANHGFTEEAESAWDRVTPEHGTTCGKALQTGERVIVSDVETCEFIAGTDDQKTFCQAGIRAVQTTPLVSRSGDMLGMFSTHWETPHDMSELDLGRLDVLARQVADLIEHRQTTDALRESEARLDAFVTATSEVVYRMSPNWIEMNELEGQGFIADTDESRRNWIDDYIPPDEQERVQDAIDEAIETKSTFELEHQVLQVDKTRGWTHSRAVPMLNDDGEITEWFGTASDVTERKQREQLLEKQKELLELIATGSPLEECLSALCAAIPQLGSGVRASIMLADDECESFQRPIAPNLNPSWGEGLKDAPINDLMIGTCGEAVFRGEAITCRDVTTDDRWSKEWRELCVANGVHAGHSEPILGMDGEPVGSLMLCFDEPRVPSEWEHRLADFSTDIAGIAVERDQSHRTLEQANQSLKRLNSATRTLIDADTKTISNLVAELTREVLDMEYAALWRYDDRSGDLEEHTTDTAGDVDAEAISLPTEISDRVWQTFIGTDVDVENNPDVWADASLPLRSRVLVPLGRHGVVCIGSTQAETFDERTVDLVETIAATIEAAWDRAEGEQEVTRQNEELTRLDQLNILIRDIDRVLVEADTMDAIDEAVCERLADSDLYEFAWIGEFDADADAVRPRAWAGVDSAALETLTTGGDGTEAVRDLFSDTIRTRELQVVADIATDTQAAPWREAALERGARSCLSIPLTYSGSVYGVLVVYGSTPQRDERDIEVLAELGDTIAHALNAVETRETLRTDSVVELTLRTTGATTPLCRLARQLECPIEFEGLVPDPGDDATVFFTVSDVRAANVLAASAESFALDTVTCLVDSEGDALFRACVTEPTLASLFLEENVVVRSLTIDPTATTAVVDVFQADQVREFLDQLRDSMPNLELLARRTKSRPLETRQTFDDRLTSRQQEVLHTAYRSGFFQSPRVQTAKELAATLDISTPTFTYHLREAERKLCELVFDPT